jgi:hypothetical protein
MKNLKTLFLCSFLIFVLMDSYCQEYENVVTTYYTYDDYKSDRGKEIGYVSSFSIGIGHVILFVGDEKKSVDLQDYWGFSVDSILFRVKKSYALRVYSVGKIVYYEDGPMHLNLLIDGYAGVEDGENIYYYSQTLNSEIFNSSKKMIKSMNNPDNEIVKMMDEIRKSHSIMDMKKQINAIRKCVLKYN